MADADGVQRSEVLPVTLFRPPVLPTGLPSVIVTVSPAGSSATVALKVEVVPASWKLPPVATLPSPVGCVAAESRKNSNGSLLALLERRA